MQIIVFQAVLLLVVLSNAYLLHRPRRHVKPDAYPRVSILVPARNEEEKIAICLQSLLAQDYPSYEVLALDDQSSDATLAILRQLAGEHPGLKVLVGSSPAPGWSGKSWACQQLTQQAQGDLLLFTDADTVYRPQTLRALVAALIGEQADLLTGFPRQEMLSLGEKLLVPFFSWASLCFLSLGLAYRLRLPALSNAVGQVMLFRREAYQGIGGHGSVGPAIVEDLELARQVKAAGLRWRVANLTDLVSCRMYAGSRAALDGFTKNFFAAFNFRLLPYLFVFTWLAVMFWKPLILLAQVVFGQAPPSRLGELLVCIGLAFLLWLVSYLVLGLPPRLALLYPLTILANEVVAFRSLYLSLSGHLTWKERSLARPHWKWL